MPDLTSPEEQLIERAKLRFGDPLTQFLLTGLGEVETFNAVTVHFGPVEPPPFKLKIVSPSYEGLPKGKEPLVLLYLLNDIKPRDCAYARIVQAQVSGIYETLEWDFNEETFELIRSAILKYFDTSFEFIRDEGQLIEGATNVLSSIRRLVISYDMAFDEDGGGRKELSSASVDMAGEMVKDLFDRTFMNIPWYEIERFEK